MSPYILHAIYFTLATHENVKNLILHQNIECLVCDGYLFIPAFNIHVWVLLQLILFMVLSWSFCRHTTR